MSVWKAWVDEDSGATYWHNTVTDETTWDEPADAAADVPPQKVAQQVVASTPVHSLWQKFTDPDSGCPYWYNEGTGESTWEEPVEAGPASKPVTTIQIDTKLAGLQLDAPPLESAASTAVSSAFTSSPARTSVRSSFSPSIRSSGRNSIVGLVSSASPSPDPAVPSPTALYYRAILHIDDSDHRRITETPHQAAFMCSLLSVAMSLVPCAANDCTAKVIPIKGADNNHPVYCYAHSYLRACHVVPCCFEESRCWLYLWLWFCCRRRNQLIDKT